MKDDRRAFDSLSPSPQAGSQLVVEVCNGENFIRTSSACRCIVRLQYRNTQKKTKKNVNCRNPKFYEVFRFPLLQSTIAKKLDQKPMNCQEGITDDLELLVQVISVEMKDSWKIVAQEVLNIREFKDELVH